MSFTALLLICSNTISVKFDDLIGSYYRLSYEQKQNKSLVYFVEVAQERDWLGSLSCLSCGILCRSSESLVFKALVRSKR